MSENDLRISADELRRRIAAGEQFTIVDARNPQAWSNATDMARGAIRIDMHSDEPLPELPRERPIAIYCT